MLTLRDTIAGEPIRFRYVENKTDLPAVARFINSQTILAMDTEGTGVNCYKPGWRLRTFQVGNSFDSYVIPARFKSFIWWASQTNTRWIGHNGPHDWRCIDRHLGRDTGGFCIAETHIPSHHLDSRNRQEGGVGHGLKELSCALIDPQADKWEVALKKEFKKIVIPIPGQVYKSGPRKGTQKYRKAKLAEGWKLIELDNPAYIAYAAADPLLAYRLWQELTPVVKEYLELYKLDLRTAQVCDTLQRRAILMDRRYTERLSAAYLRKAERLQAQALTKYGCRNINSTEQLANTLLGLGATLRERTNTGKYKVDADILRALLDDPYSNGKVKSFIHCVLVAKQVLKRRSTYTEAMLREADSEDRVHPAINSLAARTARMSVREPALQQLPTQDHEDELLWESEEML